MMVGMEQKCSWFKTCHFDIDVYLNPILPSSPLRSMNSLLSRFLGYRKEPTQEYGNIIIALWTLLSTYVALLLVALIFKLSPWIQSLHPPVLIGSLGAAAILEYNALASPLAQPRNALLGHIISAIIGVAVAQALDSSATSAYLLAPLACGLASATMSLTGAVHPPGGATAVLAVTDPGLRALGWNLVPLTAIACTVMIVVACLMGNVVRRYPVWWWSAGECGTRWKRNYPAAEDTEAVAEEKALYACDESTTAGSMLRDRLSKVEDAMVLISLHGVLYPPNLYISDNEIATLKGLAARLDFRYNTHH